MDHAKAQDAFSDYWERVLDEPVRKQVEEHLSQCEACTKEYEAFQKAMAPLGKLHKVAAPEIAEAVPQLINRRSRGRFFAPKAWKDYMQLEWLLLGMLGLVILVYVFVKLSHPSIRVH